MSLMKKIWRITALCLLACLQQACEQTLPLDDLTRQETEGIALAAMLNPDSTFRAYVTRAYLYTDKPLYPSYRTEDVNEHFYEEYYEDLDIEDWHGYGTSEIYENFKASTLADANVELQVNGAAGIKMRYDAEKLCFRSDYTPAAGDRIRLQITGSDGQTTVAESEVPQAQKLEILSMEKEEKALNYSEMINSYKSEYCGYVVKFKLRLTDPQSEKNYYRLKVRMVSRANISHVDELRFTNDHYMSDDLIFRDERLTEGWAGWDAYFSDVFDDRLFDGEQYTFEVESYAMKGTEYRLPETPNYIVELQSLSEDYYLYLKSMMLYRISASDVFSEGIYIHSNNEGGWGMLGALNGEEHIMLWNEEQGVWNEE